jgi:hypothetical protein
MPVQVHALFFSWFVSDTNNIYTYVVPGTGIEPVRPLSGSGGFSSHCGFHRQPFAVCALDYAFTLALKR